MKVGDLVKHKKLGWIGHVVTVQPVKAIMDDKKLDVCLIIDVVKSNGSFNRFASIDLEVLDGT